MRRGASATLAMVMGLVMTVVGAQAGPAEVAVEVVEFGLYTLRPMEGGTWPRSGPGMLQVSLMRRPYLRSTVVPLKPGIVFGLSFRLKRGVSAATPIRIIVDGPPLTTDRTGRHRYQAGQVTVLAGQVQHVLIRLTSADVAGGYRVRLFYRGRQLAGRAFQIK
ncbi:MAG: DUF3859 domain-containing protein [Proteobacteria bacterium]|nr:DUF3859 domain-containing protein [Pseudomonadota bacterium]